LVRESASDGKIVLTADRTLMSDYNHNIFLGFGACAPPNFIPNWLYGWLFFPPIKTKKGVPVAAPYALRKVEAQLLLEGFDVTTVSPLHLKDHLDDAKVLGVHAMDPFGLGPASTTFAFVLKKEPYLAQFFRALMMSPEVKKAKKRGMKVIVGGQGVWQFQHRPRFVKKYGVDCIVMGEAEKVVGKVFRAALNGEELPEYYQTDVKETPGLDEIPDIVNPSVDGLVELGRGCCRGCEFCSVTLRPLRWCSLDKILREIDVNINSGYTRGVALHAEDVMLYGSTNVYPNERKLLELHEVVSKKCDNIGWSHSALASVVVNPKLFGKISEIILQKQRWWGAQVGLETGSGELAKKMMPAKAYPFKAEEWPNVAREGLGLMHDNKLVPACTLIVGSPEETEDDVIKTLELMDDVKGVRSLIVPLFFVPMGRLKNEEWFKETEMTELHKQLLVKCLNHGMYWVNELIDMSFTDRWYRRVVSQFYHVFARIVRYRVRKAGIAVGNGDD